MKHVCERTVYIPRFSRTVKHVQWHLQSVRGPHGARVGLGGMGQASGHMHPLQRHGHARL